MTILVENPKNDKPVQVLVLDIFDSGGKTFAAVEALEGRPFVGGDLWPVHTPFTTVELDKLLECNCCLSEQVCSVCRKADLVSQDDAVASVAVATAATDEEPETDQVDEEPEPETDEEAYLSKVDFYFAKQMDR
jgi:hypothetical protein